MHARWFVRGDLDGFFGLALDNLIQLLVIVALCKGVLQFPDALVFATILPAVGLSLLVGNVFYAWQGMRLARRESRHDVCAIPYGVNTVSLFVFVFLVMLPAKQQLAVEHDAETAARMAWQAGLVACFGSGVIELLGAFVVDRLRRYVPRAALLSTLSGIALTFISLDFLFRSFEHPLVGLPTFAVVCIVYFGGVRFRGGIPGGAVAVALGAAICWATGLAPGADPQAPVGVYAPTPVPGDLWDAFQFAVPQYFSVIFAMGLFNLLGSLQNLDSAEAAGDRFATRPSLAANGIGTIVGSLFGSCFPTTIYIGHPGWKALGARLGYSWLNGAFMTVICLTGTVGWIAWAVPIEAGMAIVLWISIVITAQAFQATPRAHAPAVVIGLLPGVAAWGAFMLKRGAASAGATFDESLGPALERVGVHFEGVFSLAEGGIFTAMLLAAAAVAIIERRFRLAACWCWAGAAMSFFGLMHGWRWTETDTSLELGINVAPEAALGYALAGALLFAVPWIGIVDAPTDANGDAPRDPTAH